MRMGETIDVNAGLNKPDLYSEDDLELNAEEANKNLLEGFQIPTNLEEFKKQYDEMFEGIETAELELYQKVLESAPVEAQEALKDGDTSGLVEHARKSGIIGKGLLMIAAFGILMSATSAFGAGNTPEKVKMFSPQNNSGAHSMEQVVSGGGGGMKIGGGKIVFEDANQKAQTDFETKVADHQRMMGGNNSVEDGSGNQNNQGRISVDGKQI